MRGIGGVILTRAVRERSLSDTVMPPFSRSSWEELVTCLNVMIRMNTASAQVLRDQCRQVQLLATVDVQ